MEVSSEEDVGFITTTNKLISKSIKKGEIIVFSKGLVHYQKNSGDKPALVLSAFNRQLPGTFSVARKSQYYLGSGPNRGSRIRDIDSVQQEPRHNPTAF
ncbi:germin-like protein subfamily 2 member 2 [Vigna angularis]|uniref:germin-like protein subfamily 2 member 2 n=1 Tax=Phaseolus angularis TaxID=3914 RepID=UPI0022B454D6|nr:germin-like protein subfamily 2 member 2 [Vigna angularis]